MPKRDNPPVTEQELSTALVSPILKDFAENGVDRPYIAKLISDLVNRLREVGVGKDKVELMEFLSVSKELRPYVDMLIKIFGLYAPDKKEFTGKDGAPLLPRHTEDEAAFIMKIAKKVADEDKKNLRKDKPAKKKIYV